jgi:antirestriction protein
MKTLSEDVSAALEIMVDKYEDMRIKLQEFNKDEEIIKLKNELRETRTSALAFLTKSQQEAAKTFTRDHYSTHKGNTRYIVEGTGIGDIIKVQCTKCNIIEDITEISSW